VLVPEGGKELASKLLRLSQSHVFFTSLATSHRPGAPLAGLAAEVFVAAQGRLKAASSSARRCPWLSQAQAETKNDRNFLPT
jgi:hypothetical protein